MSGRSPDRQQGLRAAYRAAQAHLVAYESAPGGQTREAVLGAARQIARNVQAGVVDTAPPDFTLPRVVPAPSRPPPTAARSSMLPVSPSGAGDESSFLLTDLEDDEAAIEPAAAERQVPPAAANRASTAPSVAASPAPTVPPVAADAASPLPPGAASGDATLPPAAGNLASPLPTAAALAGAEDSGFLDLSDTLPGAWIPDAAAGVDVALDLEPGLAPAVAASTVARPQDETVPAASMPQPDVRDERLDAGAPAAAPKPPPQTSTAMRIEPAFEASLPPPAVDIEVGPDAAAPRVVAAPRAAANAPTLWIRAGLAAAVAAVVAIGAWRMQPQRMPGVEPSPVADAGTAAVATPAASTVVAVADVGAASAAAATATLAPSGATGVALAPATGSPSANPVVGTPLPPVAANVNANPNPNPNPNPNASAPIIVATTAPNRLETDPGSVAERAGSAGRSMAAPASILAGPVSKTVSTPPPARQAPQALPKAAVADTSHLATRPASAAARVTDVAAAKPGATAEWSPQEIQRAAERARAAQRALAQENSGGADAGASSGNPAAAPATSLAPATAPATAPAAAPAPAPAPAAPTGSPSGQLHRAADRGDVVAIKHVLATSGVAVDTPDATGRTPLLQAVLSRRPGAVRALLAAGADPTRADQSGLTPEAAAHQGRSPEIAQILGAPR